jgi:ferredoxin-NADP reductase
MAQLIEAVVRHIVVCARDTLEVGLSKPEGYTFEAGQWFRLAIDTDEGVQTKTFSHAATPSDPEIMMATRSSESPFKRALSALSVGDRVAISASGGRLSLPRDAPALLFLTGGVGVTPVRSLVMDARARGRDFDDLLILYGNRDPECAPYLEELAATGARMVPVYEDAPDDWPGERGFISAEMVRRHMGADDGRPVIVTGPPAMVEAMMRVLDEMGIAPSRRLVERFGPSRRPL